MSIPRIVTALSYIDDELVSGAIGYKRKKSTWKMWAAMAACLCLVSSLFVPHLYMKHYVQKNHIVVHNSSHVEDVSVLPEYADEVETAYRIHGILSQQEYPWYGNCFFDSDSETIMVGLTEVTDSNKEAVLAHTADTPVAFYPCKYSDQYLQQLNSKLEENRAMLSFLGVERFGVSMMENRVYVYIGNPRNYMAIYAVSRLDSQGGAIEFITGEAVYWIY